MRPRGGIGQDLYCRGVDPARQLCGRGLVYSGRCEKGRGWKVASFRETEQELTGTSSYVSRADVEAAECIFQQYLDALAARDWQGAAKYMAGPARRRQEMGATVLGKEAVIGKMGNIKAESVCERGKEMIIRFDYEAVGKHVSVVVTFFRRNGVGWLQG